MPNGNSKIAKPAAIIPTILRHFFSLRNPIAATIESKIKITPSATFAKPTKPKAIQTNASFSVRETNKKVCRWFDFPFAFLSRVVADFADNPFARFFFPLDVISVWRIFRIGRNEFIFADFLPHFAFCGSRAVGKTI